MRALDDPFAVAVREIEALRAKTRIVIVDFHAEATSEKIAMAWHLDGRATAVLARIRTCRPPMSGSCPKAPPA